MKKTVVLANILKWLFWNCLTCSPTMVALSSVIPISYWSRIFVMPEFENTVKFFVVLVSRSPYWAFIWVMWYCKTITQWIQNTDQLHFYEKVSAIYCNNGILGRTSYFHPFYNCHQVFTLKCKPLLQEHASKETPV